MQPQSKAQKVALVTGAARRIGAAIARTLHHAGVDLIVHYYTSKAEASRLVDELNSIRQNSAISLPCDLKAIDSFDKFKQRALECFGRLDILINNASDFYKTPFLKTSSEDWDNLLLINLKSPFFLAKTFAEALGKNHGSIINITDIHGMRPMKDYGAYCISKSGLIMLTKVLAKELGPLVRVNAISPGSIIWPEGENSLSVEVKDQIIDKTILKRSGRAEDIAKTALFLTRDADYITGQVINVDGGRTL